MNKQTTVKTAALGFGVKAHLAEIELVNGKAEPSFAKCGKSLKSVMHNLQPAASVLDLPDTNDHLARNAVRLTVLLEVAAKIETGELEVCDTCAKSLNRLVTFLTKQQKVGA